MVVLELYARAYGSCVCMGSASSRGERAVVHVLWPATAADQSSDGMRVFTPVACSRVVTAGRSVDQAVVVKWLPVTE